MMNPLLSKLNENKSQSDLMQTMYLIKKMFIEKNPNDVVKQLIKTNPEFKKFAEQNADKTVEDICMEYDIDINLLKQFL